MISAAPRLSIVRVRTTVLAVALVGCAPETATDVEAPRDAPAAEATITCENDGPCEGTDPSEDAEAPVDPDDADDPPDAVPPDTVPSDTGVLDAGAIDGGRMDAGPIDGGRADAVAADVARSDVVRTDTGADAGVTFLPLPTCANVNQRLRADFGIVIQPGTIAFEGLPSEDITCAQRILVYQMFIRPHQYERFPRRVNVSDAYTLHLYRRGATNGSCSAYTPSGQAILVRDLRGCLAAVSGPSDPDFARIAMFLIHETGHIITSRTYSLRAAFDSAGLTRLDPACYDRGFLKTYSLRTTNPVSESFAEATALFIGRRKVGVYGTINNFATECPHTFSWIQTTVFGNRR